MRKRIFGGWLGLSVKIGLVVVLTTIVCSVLFTLANLDDRVNNFALYVRTNNAEMAKRELTSLHYFYDLSRKWKIQWLADKYLFRGAPFYEAADSYLIRDWAKVKEALKEKLDDPMAYPYGNAKFREVQGRFQEKDVKLEEALNFILTEVAADFERDLRNCLGSGVDYYQCYDRVWNYDLATNKKFAEEALKNTPPRVKYVLGPPKEEPGEIPLPKFPGGGKEGEEQPGSGGPRKRR